MVPLTAQEWLDWQLLASTDYGQALVDFVPMLNVQQNFLPPKHLKLVADLLVRAEREPVRACISLPPRHSKTETLLAAIVWWLLRDPTQQIAYVSHTATFAEGRMIRARDLAEFVGIPRGSVWRQDEWQTALGGRVLARGIRGPITGEGFDKLVIDDPCKSREEAESPLLRERNWDWLVGVALKRLTAPAVKAPGGSAFVVHTRWHDDDLIGRLSKLTDSKWESVNLPAICVDEKNDLNKRQLNEPLWPEVWPWEQLDLKRRESQYEWASQYMGQPVPKGGRVFKEPSRYAFPKFEGARIIIGCDPAAGGSATSDYSAICVLAVRGTGVQTEVDILDIFREQISIPDLVRKLVEYQKEWNAPITVEAVGGFKAIPQMLRDIDPQLRIVEAKVIGNKFDRAQPVASAWNDVPGRVRIPAESRSWVKPFLDEVCSFTGVKDAHDDQVDALAHAFNFAIQLTSGPEYGGVKAEFAQ